MSKKLRLKLLSTCILILLDLIKFWTYPYKVDVGNQLDELQIFLLKNALN